MPFWTFLAHLRELPKGCMLARIVYLRYRRQSGAKLSWEKLDSLGTKANELQKKIENIKLNPENSAEFQTLADKIKLAEDKLENSKEKAEGLQRSIMSLAQTGLGETTKDLSGLSAGADKAGRSLRKALDTKTLQRFMTGTKKLLSAFGRFFTVIGKGASSLVRGVGRIAGSMNILAKNTQKTNGMLSKLSHRIRDIVVAAFVFNVLRKGFTDMRDYMGGLLKTNDQFMKSLNAIKVNLRTAFQPIFETILPAVNTLMAALAKLTGYIASFTAALFGKTVSQSKNAAESINAEADAIKNVGEQAKKAGKNLQGFDQLNKLAADDTGTGSGAGGLDWDVEPPDTRALSWLDELAEKVKTIADQLNL